MKGRPTELRKTILGGLAVLATVLMTLPLQASQVTIDAMILDVKHRSGPEGEWEESWVGVSLPAGSRVRTGKRSACEIGFPDGSYVRMGSRSDCVITDPETTEVKVVAGEVFVEIVSGQGGSVEGGTATAAVKGTRLWFRGPSAPGEEPARTADTAYVWFGDADFWSPDGSLTLQPGQGSTMPQTGGPTPAVAAFPPEYGSGRLYPWWVHLRPGMSVQVTPGTSVGEDFKNDQKAMRTAGFAFARGRPTAGEVDLIVESVSPAGLSSTVASPALAALTVAPLAPLSNPQVLGRRFFAVPGQLDLASFVLSDHGFGAIWGRAAGMSGQYYGEVGLEVATDFSNSLDSYVSDLFVLSRQRNTDLTAGRQRYLLGPVNNGPLGSLFGVTHFDGVSLQHRGQDFSAFGAWLDDFRTPTQSDLHSSGWFGRLSTPVAGGRLGVNALQERDEGWGWSADLALPAIPHYLDAYLEVGVDPEGRNLHTYGVYLPRLYQSANVDLYVELAQRQQSPATWSVLAYVDAGRDWMGLAGARNVQGQDWEFALGATKHLGGFPSGGPPRSH